MLYPRSNMKKRSQGSTGKHIWTVSIWKIILTAFHSKKKKTEISSWQIYSENIRHQEEHKIWEVSTMMPEDWEQKYKNPDCQASDKCCIRVKACVSPSALLVLLPSSKSNTSLDFKYSILLINPLPTTKQTETTTTKKL